MPPLSNPSEYRPGDAIGPYAIESCLGHGGTGVVFAATDVETGRPVAIKVLRKGLHIETAWPYRLLREGSFKLIETSTGETFFYDLARDPGETRDLAAERSADVSAMKARLAQVEQEIGLPELGAPLAAEGGEPELDPATREHLRALGYAE